MKKTVNGLRKLACLRWTSALEDGFAANGKWKQPATLANLSAVIINHRGLKSYLERRYDEFELRPPIDKEIYTYITQNLYGSMRAYYGDCCVGRYKTTKEEKTDILLREGIADGPHGSVTAHYTTKTGEDRADFLEGIFEERRDRARSSIQTFSWDTVQYPKKVHGEWEIYKLEAPRIEEGEDLETGATLPKKTSEIGTAAGD